MCHTVSYVSIFYKTGNYLVSSGCEARVYKSVYILGDSAGDGAEFEKIAESKEIYSAYLREETDLGETQPIVENWLFNNEHKVGDSEIIEDENYVYVVIYEGDGEISWKIKARESLLNNALNEYFAAIMEKHPINFNLENMKLLSGVTAFTGTN